MSCVPTTEEPAHVPKEVEAEQIPLGIHELIDKKVWKSDPAAVNEAKKEAHGLIEAGTWDYKHVIQRHDLERQARQSGTKVAIGRLMTIMSWKNAESESETRLKARIAFLGNNVRDEFWFSQRIPRNQNHSYNNCWIEHKSGIRSEKRKQNISKRCDQSLHPERPPDRE